MLFNPDRFSIITAISLMALPLLLTMAAMAADKPSVTALIGADKLPRYAQSDAIKAEAALKAVKDTDGPEKVYGAWNDFCRTHFGAEAEPTLYKRFGEKLKVNDDGTWKHVSENSAAMAWETNLPAQSWVEYGESADYGQQTEKTERPFYLHVHHVKGLEPGKTYHYRLVAVDERGNKLATADRTIEPKKVEGAVYIPGDMEGPPYKLDQADTTYILTEDITTPGVAITTLRDGITLDLNGHTVTFADGDEVDAKARETAGIVAAGGHNVGKINYQATDLRVLNGTVRQGNSEALAKNKESLAFNCMKLTGQDIEVAGVKVVYHAPQAWGVQMNHSKGKLDIHHNVFVDKGAKIVNRHGSAVRTLGFRYPKASPNEFEIHHNLVARTRQNGLGQAHKMYNNEVYVDSWSINSFAMQPESKPGIDAGEHYENKIFATGFNPYGFGWAHENLKIHDNLIHMHGIDLKARWIHMEKWGDINCLEGMRVTNYSKGGQVRNNLQYWNNAIILRGSEDVELRGTGFYSDETIKGLVFRDNYVKVEALDLETGRAACIDPQGHSWKEINQPVYYIDNVLESNIHNVRCGDSYGKGNNHHFVRCEFVKLGSNPNFTTIMFDGGGYNGGHVLLDCEFGPGTAYDDVYWKSTTIRSHYSVAWTLSLTTAPGADITVADKDGTEVFSGKADENGKVAVPLTVCTIRPVEWKPDLPKDINSGSKKKREHQKQVFGPHTVSVEFDGKTASKKVELTEPTSIELRP